MMTTPTERMKGFAATDGKDRTAAARTTRPTALRSTDPCERWSVTVTVSEALGKTTSEESLRSYHQGGEQRDVEERLGPRGPEGDLEQGLPHAEHHRGDGRTRDAAQATDDDDRHQRADPVPVERGVEGRVEGERGPADGCGGEAEAEAVAGHPFGVDADQAGRLRVLDGGAQRLAELRLLHEEEERCQRDDRQAERDQL